jgi:hypothetical protein
MTCLLVVRNAADNRGTRVRSPTGQPFQCERKYIMSSTSGNIEFKPTEFNLYRTQNFGFGTIDSERYINLSFKNSKSDLELQRGAKADFCEVSISPEDARKLRDKLLEIYPLQIRGKKYEIINTTVFVREETLTKVAEFQKRSDAEDYVKLKSK